MPGPQVYLVAALHMTASISRAQGSCANKKLSRMMCAGSLLQSPNFSCIIDKCTKRILGTYPAKNISFQPVGQDFNMLREDIEIKMSGK